MDFEEEEKIREMGFQARTTGELQGAEVRRLGSQGGVSHAGALYVGLGNGNAKQVFKLVTAIARAVFKQNVVGRTTRALKLEPGPHAGFPTH